MYVQIKTWPPACYQAYLPDTPYLPLKALKQRRRYLANMPGFKTFVMYKAVNIPQTKNEPVHEISINVVCVTSKGSDQPAHMRSLIRAFARHLNIL